MGAVTEMGRIDSASKFRDLTFDVWDEQLNGALSSSKISVGG